MHEISYETKEWLAYSKRDLDSANYLLEMRPLPLEIICFHCQQSAEKALKAFMVEHKIEVIKTHDLKLLRKICCDVSDFSAIEIECSRLTPFAAQSRYPFAIEVKASDMHLALRDAQVIWDFVQKELKLEN